MLQSSTQKNDNVFFYSEIKIFLEYLKLLNPKLLQMADSGPRWVCAPNPSRLPAGYTLCPHWSVLLSPLRWSTRGWLGAHLLSFYMAISPSKDIENTLMFLRLDDYYPWWQTITAGCQANHFIARICGNSDFLKEVLCSWWASQLSYLHCQRWSRWYLFMCVYVIALKISSQTSSML